MKANKVTELLLLLQHIIKNKNNMATKFTSLEGTKREKKETVFFHHVTGDMEIGLFSAKPDDYENVLHLWTDKIYGDVFKVWNDKATDNAVLVFGTKGYEFD